MAKSPNGGKQMQLPVLAAIAGGTARAPSTRRQQKQEGTAALSTWPAFEPGEADKAIFDSIASDYFQKKKSI